LAWTDTNFTFFPLAYPQMQRRFAALVSC
jgi:hypothetical protein